MTFPSPKISYTNGISNEVSLVVQINTNTIPFPKVCPIFGHSMDL